MIKLGKESGNLHTYMYMCVSTTSATRHCPDTALGLPWTL